MTVFNFNSESTTSQWQVVDDVVMGGRSDGKFKINKEGHGEFSGVVSLKNNGGFSSLRHNFETITCESYSKFKIKIKGDGKSYQFRVKTNKYDRHSYIYAFETSGDWQTIEIPFSDMYPAFRGYQLNIPNYEGQQMEQIAVLIGNKKAESFSFLIDSIILE